MILYDSIMKTTALPLRNLMNRSPLRGGYLLILLTLICFALPPQVRATCQDACLTNNNTVQGEDALLNNTTGSGNTAIGFDALLNNTDGFNNTANGANALSSNTTGFNNTASGALALYSNVSGGGNTAIGYDALVDNTNGDFNTAIGYGALSPANGSGNIAIGWRAGSNHAAGDHNIYIGSEGTVSESNTIRIGRNPFNPSGATTATFIQGISGATVPTGVAVIVNANGHLGTTTSSARYKESIKPMDKGSEAILALKPVTFRYKHELDPEGIPQFGLVAEDVEKVNPDLVARDKDGKPYTVRYEAVNAMLLNEFLKEHRTVEQLEKQVAALTAGLQKVSAQLEASKSAPQVVLNNQ
jgi:Chaperone of endosialidase